MRMIGWSVFRSIHTAEAVSSRMMKKIVR